MNPKVFYDGACILCDKEIRHYKKKDTNGRIDWIDISLPEFEAEKYQLSPKKVRQEMHSLSSNGDILVGIDTFVLIWDELNVFRPLARMAKTSWIRPLFDGAYVAFAAIRPSLPKKKNHCQEHCEV